MSIKKTLVVVNETGLHMRPGKLFVTEAKKYESEISIMKGVSPPFNAKSLIKLMKAGLSKGTEITLKADGLDEEKAVRELADFIANLKE